MDRFTFAAVVATVVISQITLSHALPTSQVHNVKMPKSCANMTFCTHKHKDYPKKIIEQLLIKSNTDILFDEYVEGVGQRIGPDHNLEPKDECVSAPSIDPIYEIVDVNGRVRFVVQSEKRFKQIIRIEQCDNPGPVRKATKNLSYEALTGVNLECHQCMLNYKFVVLSLDRKTLEAVNVKGGLPVCCSCRRR